jgi:glycosyltransferase involved in cell wall biosynthesis
MSQKILWFNWKDINHPEAGGAEVVTHELAKRLVSNGFEVTLLTARYANSGEFDEIDGIKIIRAGNGRLSHYFVAGAYYLKHLKNKYDILIEEINTIPYFSSFYKGKEKHFLFYHQLCREVWFYQMTQPLSTIGYLFAEPFYTWLLSWFKTPVITISNSTKMDLQRFGFKPETIKIIPEGISNTPLAGLSDSKDKEAEFTVLFHSSLREMKRPLETLKAFEIFYRNHPNSKLWFSGGGDRTELTKFANDSKISNSVIFFGRTTDDQKLELMQKATVLCSTSLKEGWGLIVTETNSMGTPAIVYDVDGLRDAAATGGNWIADPNPESLAQKLTKAFDLFTNNREKYETWRAEVLEKSRPVNFEHSYEIFKDLITK